VIEVLPQIAFARTERPELAGPDHPIRKVTRQIAFEPGSWTPERAAKVAALFDRMAPEWHTRGNPERSEALADALERGAVGAGRCVEIGSGTGLGTALLRSRFERVVAIDLALEMLRRLNPEWGHRVQADAAGLPLRDAAADVLVHVNTFLFPSEVERVLAPAGTLIWVCSLGDATPIYLSARDVQAALPGRWRGTASRAGWGSWCTLRRDPVRAGSAVSADQNAK